MPKGKWSIFLTIVTILGLILISVPWLVLIAIIFPPLFFILLFMPSIFIYSWAITIFFMLFKFIGKARYIAAPLVVIIISLAIPYHFNLKTFERIEELANEDITLEAPLPTGGVLAFEIPSSHGTRGKNGNKCQSLCQRLLYNKAYKSIVIKFHDRKETYNFHLENRTTCPSYKLLSDGAAAKIANGECLIETKGLINQVDFIYRNEVVAKSDRNIQFKLNAMPVRATRITLIDNRTSVQNTLYQKTKIMARPFSYPFIIWIGFKSGFTHDLEIKRPLKKINEHAEKDSENIFGEPFIKNIKTDLKAQAKIIYKYLNNPLKSKLEAVQVLKSFWDDMSKKDVYTPQEVNIMADAASDNRVKLPTNFYKIIHKIEDIPNKFVVALGNRVLNGPDLYASEGIMALSDGKAKIIAPQLEQVLKNKELRVRNWKAVSRLGDGSDLAVSQYIDVLQQYETYLRRGSENRDVRNQQMEAVSGAVVGLCRLEKKALAAKGILYSIFETGDRRTRASSRIARALIHIADMSELERKYLNNILYKYRDRTGRGIQRAIQIRDILLREGRNSCS